MQLNSLIKGEEILVTQLTIGIESTCIDLHQLLVDDGHA
jgi:hypothetical protein